MTMAPENGDHLVVFTTSYPFSRVVESFLDRELPHLSSVFDTVTLVPRLSPPRPARGSTGRSRRTYRPRLPSCTMRRKRARQPTTCTSSSHRLHHRSSTQSSGKTTGA
ncbi:hypothetical protein [Methanoculleus chikugoensis]|uniref:hypothetical protein n=1 Tax=Methanoculleus chikugoensis TaxID=118126 RepID=UPI001FB1D8D0|nr:hypothetical protein [Methanoculleus chikugoensis]